MGFKNETVQLDNWGGVRSKSDLKDFLNADKYALGKQYQKRPMLMGDEIWKFEIALRKHEFYVNCAPKNPMRFFWAYRHHKLGVKLGFEIPCNVFLKGLRINHFGLIVVNSKARIGEFCDIHQGVNIGENTDKKAPSIGNDVWIGPGAKIFGGINIGNNVMIGANSVVTKSFPDNVIVMGIPAAIKKVTGNLYTRSSDYKSLH